MRLSVMSMMLISTIRTSLRLLARTPSLTAAVVLTFALGIGVNGAVFCVANAVLLRPLPYPDSARLVAIAYAPDASAGNTAGANAAGSPLAPPKPAAPSPLALASPLSATANADLPSPLVRAWQRRSRAFDAFATYSISPTIWLRPDGEQVPLVLAAVSANVFDVLRTPPPMLGRAFTEDEARRRAPVAMVSHAFWLARFGGDPAIIGRTAAVGGRTYTLIGVTPPGFVFPDRARPDLFAPIALPATEAMVQFARVIGRLSPDAPADADRAERELAAIDRSERPGFPTAMRPWMTAHASPRVLPLQQALAGDVRPVLLAALGVASCVLLLACVNITGMLLARAADRRADAQIRVALGATPRRLMAAMLAEHVLLAAFGTAAALIALAWSAQGLRQVLTRLVAFPEAIALDGRTLAVVTLSGLAAGLLSSILPAAGLLADVRAFVRRGRLDSTPLARLTMRRVLVGGQVALALVLLVGSLLLIKSLWRLTDAHLGFDAQNIVTFKAALPLGASSDAARVQRAEDLLRGLRELPGVLNAGASTALPAAGHAFAFAIQVEGEPPPEPDAPPTPVNALSPGYLETVGAAVIAGRPFTPGDTSSSPRVAMVNEAFVRERLHGRDAIGRRLGLGGPPEITIVGVVRDLRNESVRTAAAPEVYRPFAQAAPQMGWSTTMVAVRTNGEASRMLAAIHERVAALGGGTAMYDWARLDERLTAAAAPERQRAALFGWFAALALALAACGLYGLMTYAVAQRWHELGVRAALGAGRSRLLAHALRQGLVPVAIGLVIGAIGAALTTRLLAGWLYGVAPADLPTFLGAAGLIVTVSLLASVLPAAKAARVDPLIVLKEP